MKFTLKKHIISSISFDKEKINTELENHLAVDGAIDIPKVFNGEVGVRVFVSLGLRDDDPFLYISSEDIYICESSDFSSEDITQLCLPISLNKIDDDFRSILNITGLGNIKIPKLYEINN